ncbi:putative FMN-dependent luciferase-like monooxygenase [Ruania zhangjianzhongii]|uniref:putative FMN-dependent luciferase-like monooxygenase n=1 Tax=Ruania zhangjianzhongii TaxID=2603206 RepID=UPI0011CC7D14|nr:putative FMN-dependent luciferase-like monooxygenase [Ruania zhangjianzhongii]
MTTAPAKQLGFFTRLLDDVPPAERYRLALEQITRAEAAGYDAIAVAQHHFDAAEGGLPSPLPFLAYAAAHTSRVRLTTGVVTLALESPVRVAEDAVVLDALSGGRLELGFASGGSPGAFTALGLDFADRREIFEANLATVQRGLAGEPVTGTEGGPLLYPPGGTLAQRIWIATFSLPWAIEAGRRGHGLMLSRTQPRPEDTPDAPLADLQNPLIDAYLEHLPAGATPRISVARSVFVAEDGEHARDLALAGLRRAPFVAKTLGTDPAQAPLERLLAATDAHTGDPADVRATLAADTALARATHLSFQVHSIDPPHQDVLRSIDLIATEVAPHLGWSPSGGTA